MVLSKLDTFLLNKIQSVSDWFQRIFGLNNFALAKIVMALCTVVEFFRIHLQSLLLGPGATNIFVFTSAMILLFLLGAIYIAEKSCIKNPEKANPGTNFFKIVRIWYIIFLLFAISDLYVGVRLVTESTLQKDYIGGLVYINSVTHTVLVFFLFFFISCNPNYNAEKSKLKKLINKLFKR